MKSEAACRGKLKNITEMLKISHPIITKSIQRMTPLHINQLEQQKGEINQERKKNCRKKLMLNYNQFLCFENK